MQDMIAHSSYAPPADYTIIITTVLLQFIIRILRGGTKIAGGGSTFSPNKLVPRRTNSLAVLVPEGVLGGKERHDSTPHAADMNSLTMPRSFSSQLG